MQRRQKIPTTERGLALIAVLWIVSLLTILATTAAAISSGRLQLIRGSEDQLQDVLTADSAIRLAIASLLSPSPDNQWSGPEPRQTSVLGTPVETRIEKESGRLHLNLGDPLLLEALLRQENWSAEDARQMVARIEDWKDPDDLEREGGAEWRQYRAAGLPYSPRNGPFESVDEVRQVLGGEKLADAVLNSLTVYGPATQVSLPDATPELLAAFHWAAETHWAGQDWPESDTEHQALPPQTGEVLRITTCLVSEDLPLCRRAIVRLTGSNTDPWQVFDWR